ncbi:hypothetical protein AAFF_G00399380 [Aldrovandia affinis]|uniref:Uncharacterized protein n=1 Tax=Aldrovandia affinis TaxID=143900 RepID=A0AAD7WLA4_9TELE|nr:hypothetical protein AAFF_G00399380 [Aldrovandia affinis]
MRFAKCQSSLLLKRAGSVWGAKKRAPSGSLESERHNQPGESGLVINCEGGARDCLSRRRTGPSFGTAMRDNLTPARLCTMTNSRGQCGRGELLYHSSVPPPRPTTTTTTTLPSLQRSFPHPPHHPLPVFQAKRATFRYGPNRAV